MPMVEKVLR